MRLKVVKGDITKLSVDAIVNAANESLLGGGGVDGAIHRAAGSGLLEECRGLHGCKTGDAKLTKGYRLPAKYVIHTVGPVWHGGAFGEAELLRSCYEKSLQIAMEQNLKSIAFPAVSTGVYGYPKKQAAEIAVNTIAAYTMGRAAEDFEVWLVAFDETTEELYRQAIAKRKKQVSSYPKFELTEECCDSLVIEVATVLLKYIIEKNELITYKELTNRLSISVNPRNLDHPLGCISNACKENGIPLLSVMVVNQETLMPGPGFFKYFFPGLKREQWDEKFVEMYHQVKKFRQWDKVLEAFVKEAE